VTAESAADNLACLIKYGSIDSPDYCLCAAGVADNFACTVHALSLALHLHGCCVAVATTYLELTFVVVFVFVTVRLFVQQPRLAVPGVVLPYAATTSLACVTRWQRAHSPRCTRTRTRQGSRGG
jgi:hypothetical protein